MWQKVCRSVDVVQRRGFRVEYTIEHDIALFRVNGSVHAVSNVCPHKHSPILHEGIVNDCLVECPLHGWTYNIITGIPVFGTSSLHVYPAREELGWVWVDIPEESTKMRW